MWTRWLAFGLLLAAGLLTLGGGSPGEEKKAEAAKLAIDVPGVPEGKCCLWRLQKPGEGRLVHQLGDPYECKSGKTARGPVTRFQVKLHLGNRTCDERPDLIPDGSRLVAKGNVIRRQDDLAHILGKFEIIRGQGPVVFVGYFEATQRLSVCHAPFGTDHCDPRDRLQGWLVGQGEGPAKGFTLRALLTARTDPLDGGTNGYALGEASLDGVLVECHE
jgi:hypothetical protein